MAKIVDVILHTTKTFDKMVQTFVVLDSMPNFKYELSEDREFLKAVDGDFESNYYYQEPCSMFKSFAGREFTIPLKNGDEIKANGQWWHTVPDSNEYYHLGISTVEELHKCYVFCSGSIKKDILDKWLSENTPKTEYEYYRKNRG